MSLFNLSTHSWGYLWGGGPYVDGVVWPALRVTLPAVPGDQLKPPALYVSRQRGVLLDVPQ